MPLSEHPESCCRYNLPQQLTPKLVRLQQVSAAMIKPIYRRAKPDWSVVYGLRQPEPSYSFNTDRAPTIASPLKQT
jgi:hypothetical protein